MQVGGDLAWLIEIRGAFDALSCLCLGISLIACLRRLVLGCIKQLCTTLTE